MSFKKVLIIIIAVVICSGIYSVSQAQEQQTYTICAIHPFTGRFAFAGIQGQDAMKDAVDMANEAGGINGKKLLYYWKDGEYKDDVGIAAFKSLQSQYKPQLMWGQSTGMTKALAPEIKERYKVLYSAYTFANVAANPKENPFLFIPGPTYDEQFAVLLKYISKQKPGANVAFFYSDTEFGREPIPFAREYAKKLGLKVVAEEVTKVGGVDVTTEILDMKQKNAEFCIFQGYVSDPIQKVMKQAKDYGLKCQFMGTFWSTEKLLLDQLGPLADEYIGVTAYSYYYQDEYPMIKKIREWNQKNNPKAAEYRTQAYMQVFMGTTLMIEALKRADKAGPVTGESLAAAFQSIKNYDVGGLMPPVTIKGNSIPVGRVVRGNSKTMRFDPITDWTILDL
jgi:branched-chain amino acid transport system substrate-binding protein